MPSRDDLTARPSVTLFFPIYNDGRAFEELVREGDRLLARLASDFEIIAINDGSKDDSGAIADALAREIPKMRVVHHPVNRGYGAALARGFAEASGMDWICFTDGDHQYDIAELPRFMKHLDRYDVIIGFRVAKSYGPVRKFISWGFNLLVHSFFGTPFRDASCGFKMIRREAAQETKILSQHAFAGGEVAVRAAYQGYRVGEVAISMYPRQTGNSSAISWKAIWITFNDLIRVYRDLMRNNPRPPR
jgi:glycosyltransferase involved in cell wall biosynthesis